MPKDKTSETKIIRTFKGEVAFLVTLALFLAGILGAYYQLVTNIAVIKTEQKNEAELIAKHLENFEKHIAVNESDHDLLIQIRSQLSFK